MRTHDGALGDLVLLDVVEELGRVVVSRGVGSDVGAFLGLSAHPSMMPHMVRAFAVNRAVHACVAVRVHVWGAPHVRASAVSGTVEAMARIGDFGEEGTPSNPVLITEAAESYEEQHRKRVRKYMLLMSFRIPALILAAIAYGVWANPWISMAIIGASIPLPWMAVLIANDRPPRTKNEPRRYDKPAGRALETGRAPAIDG